MQFPAFDPVALHLGPLAIHWYALAYLAGFLLGWGLMRVLARLGNSPLTPAQIDDFLTWAILGVILGGRIGYVLFYNFNTYLEHPAAILEVWRGGMSFHGGLIGIIAAILLYARRHKLNAFHLGDLVAVVGPIGLFLGRCANFVNGELYGRPTTLPWGIIFPSADGQPRHPSQLYEAGLEGLVLFTVLYLLAVRTKALEKPGLLGGVFISGYALSRFVVEFAREPDSQLGYLLGGLSMGQLLCIPMAAFGIWLMARARKAG